MTVSYTCTDTGLGVYLAASSLADDALTASGTTSGTCVDRAGNSATTTYAAQIDKAPPTLGFTGDAGSYGLLDTVAITCTASDALSGIASSTCPNANGPAWSFGAGSHTLSASATDAAGNTASASTTFSVVVAPAALSTLTRQFVEGSATYQALRPVQKLAVDLLVSTATKVLLDLGPATAPARKVRIDAYKATLRRSSRPAGSPQATRRP